MSDTLGRLPEVRLWPTYGEGRHAKAIQRLSGIPSADPFVRDKGDYVGKHRTEETHD